MVTFRTLKLKHLRRAQAINKRINTGEADDVEIIEFAASLVAKWDFIDADTGEPVRDLEELSTNQITELLDSFSKAFESPMNIPKANAEPSLSTSMPLSQEKPQEMPQTGYQSLYSPGD